MQIYADYEPRGATERVDAAFAAPELIHRVVIDGDGVVKLS